MLAELLFFTLPKFITASEANFFQNGANRPCPKPVIPDAPARYKLECEEILWFADELLDTNKGLM
jgi:hypothetical protein